MFNLAIEGSIGSGKTTLLNYLQKKFPNRINIYCEPVQRWRNVNGVNLFDLMYKDPKRYGFIFQSYVQLTMLEMHDEISQSQAEQIKRFALQSAELAKQIEADSKAEPVEPKPVEPKSAAPKQPEQANKSQIFQDLTNKDQKPIENDKKRKSSHDEITSVKKPKTEANRLALHDESKRPTVDYSINMMERSIFSARYIFVENLYQNDLLTDIEYKILDDTFLFLIKKQDIKLDLIIYLRSEPQECYNRMLKRSRPEETQTLQLEHFEKFHKLHEDFLIGENSLLKKVLDVPVLVINTMDTKEKMFERIDQHSLFIMNDLANKEGGLKEIACDVN